MSFHMQPLSPHLILIRWSKMATESDGMKLIAMISEALDRATGKLYFISDLRKGYMTDVETLRRLSNTLGKHPNFGGSTAFGSSVGATVFSGIFTRFAARVNNKDEIHPTYTHVIGHLEDLRPGLTHGIDWESALSG